MTSVFRHEEGSAEAGCGPQRAARLRVRLQTIQVCICLNPAAHSPCSPRDDEKAVSIEAGQSLIPWMGDSSLRIDRSLATGHQAKLLYFCTAALLHCCTAALLYCCTAVLLHCCTAVLLHCCTAVLLYCCTATLPLRRSRPPRNDSRRNSACLLKSPA